jgi:N-hydroxyarylamine O-acetyltransferase
MWTGPSRWEEETIACWSRETEGMKPAQVDAYLRLIGVTHPAWPTADVLRELHLLHLLTLPLENMSIHLVKEI